jgi:hypothetical protein
LANAQELTAAEEEAAQKEENVRSMKFLECLPMSLS